MKEFPKNQLKVIAPVRDLLRLNEFKLLLTFTEMLEEQGISSFTLPKMLPLSKTFQHEVLVALDSVGHIDEVNFYLKTGGGYHLLFSHNSLAFLERTRNKVRGDVVLDKAFELLGGVETLTSDVIQDTATPITSEEPVNDDDGGFGEMLKRFDEWMVKTKHWWLSVKDYDQICLNHMLTVDNLPSMEGKTFTWWHLKLDRELRNSPVHVKQGFVRSKRKSLCKTESAPNPNYRTGLAVGYTREEMAVMAAHGFAPQGAIAAGPDGPTTDNLQATLTDLTIETKARRGELHGYVVKDDSNT